MSILDEEMNIEEENQIWDTCDICNQRHDGLHCGKHSKKLKIKDHNALKAMPFNTLFVPNEDALTELTERALRIISSVEDVLTKFTGQEVKCSFNPKTIFLDIHIAENVLFSSLLSYDLSGKRITLKELNELGFNKEVEILKKLKVEKYLPDHARDILSQQTLDYILLNRHVTDFYNNQDELICFIINKFELPKAA